MTVQAGAERSRATVRMTKGAGGLPIEAGRIEQPRASIAGANHALCVAERRKLLI